MSTFARFKSLAAREPGLTIEQIAEKLKSHPNQVRAWIGRAEAESSGPRASAREGLPAYRRIG